MRYLFIALLALVLCTGCKKDNKKQLFRFSISNSTGVQLEAVNQKTGQIFQLPQGTTTISSVQDADAYSLRPGSPDAKKYAMEPLGQTSYSAYGYDNDLEYRFSGTVPEAAISYTSELGQKIQFAKITLPATVTYRGFSQKSCAMDIQNLQQDGTVTVEIWFRGRRIRQASGPQRAGTSAPVNGGGL